MLQIHDVVRTIVTNILQCSILYKVYTFLASQAEKKNSLRTIIYNICVAQINDASSLNIKHKMSIKDQPAHVTRSYNGISTLVDRLIRVL